MRERGHLGPALPYTHSQTPLYSAPRRQAVLFAGAVLFDNAIARIVFLARQFHAMLCHKGGQ